MLLFTDIPYLWYINVSSSFTVLSTSELPGQFLWLPQRLSLITPHNKQTYQDLPYHPVLIGGPPERVLSGFAKVEM